jgi:hypothetical protein
MRPLAQRKLQRYITQLSKHWLPIVLYGLGALSVLILYRSGPHREGKSPDSESPPRVSETSPDTSERRAAPLVPYEVTLDQSMGAIKPGARIIHLRVYDSAITKGQCVALLDAYRERAGTGQVRVDPPDTSSSFSNGEEYTPMNHWALCVRNGDGDEEVIYPQRALDKTGHTGGKASDRAGTDS